MNTASVSLIFAFVALFVGESSAFTFTTGAAVGTAAAVGTGSVIIPGASIGTGLALLGGVVLLKTAALAGLAIAGGSGSRRGHGYRGKRSAVDTNALEFAAIAQIEPQQCYRRLICDLATGQMPPSDNDVILSLFEDAAALDVTSPVFEFAVAAEVGRHVRDISVCELRYSCSVTGNELLEATA